MIPLFLLAALAMAPAEEPASDKPAKAQAVTEAERSVLLIDPKHRASDFAEAFELLRKDKPSVKVLLKTMSSGVIANVSELKASANGTLLFVKIPSNQGSKYIVVSIEDIVEIAYSPN